MPKERSVSRLFEFSTDEEEKPTKKSILEHEFDFSDLEDNLDDTLGDFSRPFRPLAKFGHSDPRSHSWQIQSAQLEESTSSDSNEFRYENKEIDDTIYKIQHPAKISAGFDILVRTTEVSKPNCHIIIPVNQRIIVKIPYFQKILDDASWKKQEKIGDHKVIDVNLDNLEPGIILTYMQIKHSCFQTASPVRITADNAFGLLFLSDYLNDEKMERKAVKFLKLNMSPKIYRMIVKELFQRYSPNLAKLEKDLNDYIRKFVNNKNCDSMNMYTALLKRFFAEGFIDKSFEPVLTRVADSFLESAEKGKYSSRFTSIDFEL